MRQTLDGLTLDRLFGDLPIDPVDRLRDLDLLAALVNDEIRREMSVAYFNARVQGRFEEALEVGPWPWTRAVAATRNVNEERGRSIRWQDGYRQ